MKKKIFEKKKENIIISKQKKKIKNIIIKYYCFQYFTQSNFTINKISSTINKLRDQDPICVIKNICFVLFRRKHRQLYIVNVKV